MFNFAFLLETAENTGNGGGNIFSNIFPFILLGAMVIFLIISSISSKKKRDKEEKEIADMKDNLRPGDELTTIGGIIGKVVSVKGETFVLETTKDKTKIRFLKSAIWKIDVKAEDLAQQVMDAKEEEANSEATEETTEENN